nr:reverse transcriptase domain, reverse transcriptase zinc-binding domain protein [Tanacetum cinerariifolium]
ANANAPLSSSSHSNSFDLQQIAAALEDKLDIRMNRFEKSLNEMKNSFITPTAPLKAVTEFQTAAVGNFIQNRQNVSNQMRPPGFHQPTQQNNNQNRFQGNNLNQNRPPNQGALYRNQPPIPPSGVIQQEPAEELIKKVQNRVNDWKNKSLSIAGRLQLIQSVLGSLHVFWALVFMLPTRVLLDIEQIMRGFLWCQGSMSRGKAKVAWEVVCLPKPIIREFIWTCIGDGNSVSMWFDKWCASSPLYNTISSRDIARAGFTHASKVRDCIQDGLWKCPNDCSGLVPKPTSSTTFVPPSRNDWDLLFQPLFDELLTPSPSVDPPTPEVIAPINEVVAPALAESTGSPSSTTVDQIAPSPSKSQTTPKTQPPVIPQDVEEDNHDIEIAHMGNDSLFGMPISEVASDQSSSTVSSHTIVHPDHQIP